MAITDWPADERPRERLLKQGAGALSDAELLAIFLRVGVAGMSAVDLARILLERFGSLNRLFAATQAEVAAVPGLGPAKYAQLQAVFELVRRALAEELRDRDTLASPGAVRDYLRLNLGGLGHEVFFALWLDAQNRLLASEALFSGTLTQPTVAHYTNNYMAEQSPSRALEATRAVMQKRQRWHGTRASCRLEAPTCRLVARRPLAALSTPHGLK